VLRGASAPGSPGGTRVAGGAATGGTSAADGRATAVSFSGDGALTPRRRASTASRANATRAATATRSTARRRAARRPGTGSPASSVSGNASSIATRSVAAGATTTDIGASPIAVPNVSARSTADVKRARGERASARANHASSSGGSPGACRLGGSNAPLLIAMNTAGTVSPSNGTRPVRH
jgi:DNA-binding protein HU-beta